MKQLEELKPRRQRSTEKLGNLVPEAAVVCFKRSETRMPSRKSTRSPESWFTGRPLAGFLALVLLLMLPLAHRLFIWMMKPLRPLSSTRIE